MSMTTYAGLSSAPNGVSARHVEFRAAINDQHTLLSAAQTHRFQQEGFLVLPALSDEVEVNLIRSLLMALFDRQTGREEGNQFDMLSLDDGRHGALQPQLIKPGLYAPALLQTRYFLRVEALARQLLGRETTLSFDHSILKPAGSLVATPWHQDEAHHEDAYFHHEQISFWMPLQDVSEHNGCMSYVPGSNLGPLLPHGSLNGDPCIHALECSTEHFDVAAALPQPVSAGSCILHSGRTLHSALPNRSNADRLVYVLVFRGPLIPRRERVLYPWLQAKRTASLLRGRRWRRHGGHLVLIARRLRQLLRSDLRTLPVKVRKLLHLTRASWSSFDITVAESTSSDTQSKPDEQRPSQIKL